MHGRFAPDPRTLVVGEARESHAHVAGTAASTGLLCNPGKQLRSKPEEQNYVPRAEDRDTAPTYSAINRRAAALSRSGPSTPVPSSLSRTSSGNRSRAIAGHHRISRTALSTSPIATRSRAICASNPASLTAR